MDTGKARVRVDVTCAETDHRRRVEETRVSLLQAVRELLFNVVKHAGVKEARVTLRSAARTGTCAVTVSDTGVGFEPGPAWRRDSRPGASAFSASAKGWTSSAAA